MSSEALSLTKASIAILFVYYGVLLIAALVGILVFFAGSDNLLANSESLIWTSLIGSFLSAIAGSCIYYVRKLYRHCIRDEIAISETFTTAVAGTAAYFAFRPVFSCAFAFLVVMSLRLENKFVSPGGEIDEGNFVYVCMFVAFLAGFGAGRVLTALERKGVPLDD